VRLEFSTRHRKYQTGALHLSYLSPLTFSSGCSHDTRTLSNCRFFEIFYSDKTLTRRVARYKGSNLGFVERHRDSSLRPRSLYQPASATYSASPNPLLSNYPSFVIACI
jgi:hypothetical protein